MNLSHSINSFFAILICAFGFPANKAAARDYFFSGTAQVSTKLGGNTVTSSFNMLAKRTILPTEKEIRVLNLNEDLRKESYVLKEVGDKKFRIKSPEIGDGTALTNKSIFPGATLSGSIFFIFDESDASHKISGKEYWGTEKLSGETQVFHKSSPNDPIQVTKFTLTAISEKAFAATLVKYKAAYANRIEDAGHNLATLQAFTAIKNFKPLSFFGAIKRVNAAPTPALAQFLFIPGVINSRAMLSLYLQGEPEARYELASTNKVGSYDVFLQGDKTRKVLGSASIAGGKAYTGKEAISFTMTNASFFGGFRTMKISGTTMEFGHERPNPSASGTLNLTALSRYNMLLIDFQRLERATAQLGSGAQPGSIRYFFGTRNTVILSNTKTMDLGMRLLVSKDATRVFLAPLDFSTGDFNLYIELRKIPGSENYAVYGISDNKCGTAKPVHRKQPIGADTSEIGFSIETQSCGYGEMKIQGEFFVEKGRLFANFVRIDSNKTLVLLKDDLKEIRGPDASRSFYSNFGSF